MEVGERLLMALKFFQCLAPQKQSLGIIGLALQPLHLAFEGLAQTKGLEVTFCHGFQNGHRIGMALLNISPEQAFQAGGHVAPLESR